MSRCIGMRRSVSVALSGSGWRRVLRCCGTCVISPTIFAPGAAALKSRPTRSDIGPAARSAAVNPRRRLTCTGTSPAAAISRRTSSSSTATHHGQAPHALDDSRTYDPT